MEGSCVDVVDENGNLVYRYVLENPKASVSCGDLLKEAWNCLPDGKKPLIKYGLMSRSFCPVLFERDCQVYSGEVLEIGLLSSFGYASPPMKNVYDCVSPLSSSKSFRTDSFRVAEATSNLEKLKVEKSDVDKSNVGPQIVGPRITILDEDGQGSSHNQGFSYNQGPSRNQGFSYNQGFAHDQSLAFKNGEQRFCFNPDPANRYDRELGEKHTGEEYNGAKYNAYKTDVKSDVDLFVLVSFESYTDIPFPVSSDGSITSSLLLKQAENFFGLDTKKFTYKIRSVADGSASHYIFYAGDSLVIEQDEFVFDARKYDFDHEKYKREFFDRYDNEQLNVESEEEQLTDEDFCERPRWDFNGSKASENWKQDHVNDNVGFMEPIPKRKLNFNDENVYQTDNNNNNDQSGMAVVEVDVSNVD
jgi:hypothetical protein